MRALGNFVPLEDRLWVQMCAQVIFHQTISVSMLYVLHSVYHSEGDLECKSMAVMLPNSFCSSSVNLLEGFTSLFLPLKKAELASAHCPRARFHYLSLSCSRDPPPSDLINIPNPHLDQTGLFFVGSSIPDLSAPQYGRQSLV